jgi:sterol desaturase/sphingolipid hydroxylase (fatty acid hydroxylase superfamily)
MLDPITYAAPVFLLCLALEAASFRFLPDDDERGYERRDTASSLSMGVGYLLIDVGWRIVVLAAFAAIFVVSPFQLSASNPYAWLLLFLLDDIAYYWFHRLHHTVRVLWASHVVHHSSQYFNFATALRQSWTPMTIFPFWLPLALFFPPWMILFQQSISMIYQFFLHTERIGTMWRPIELVMNTPSHHRVHHGSNDPYLDRNYGGILIVWDRLFGTFAAEQERVKYGLTKNIDSFRPLTVAFHEYGALWSDLRSTTSPRDRWGYLVKGPGWTPDPVPVGAGPVPDQRRPALPRRTTRPAGRRG